MTEPTEDEVLVKAKQLARDDGRGCGDTEDIEDRRRPVTASPTIPSAPNI
jgi:hypothetical protein